MEIVLKNLQDRKKAGLADLLVHPVLNPVSSGLLNQSTLPNPHKN